MIERGFVTIATGHERYYKMALTLLRSYRANTENPMPFALLCDRTNEYTEEFTDVIILEKFSKSYMDKIRLLKTAPYKETIFIDADCIVYGDLNRYWDYYQQTTDFSCFGFCHPLDSDEGYFWRDSVGDYGNQISYIPGFHGVAYFIRRGEVCDEMYETCRAITSQYQKYKFRYFSNPADEPILALAMALHKCRPIQQAGECFAYYPVDGRYTTFDYSKRLCRYEKDNRKHSILLMHFGSVRTTAPLYTIEERKVHFYHKHNRNWNVLESCFGKLGCYIRYVIHRLTNRK